MTPFLTDAGQADSLLFVCEVCFAFFNESGLASSSFGIEGPWAKNEEMVDWIALQGPKIYKVWEEAGAL